MLDLALRNGVVIDGTGAPRRRADVGIRDGVIAVVGKIDEPAQRTIDCDGQVIAPGFIDVHTHYDAQVLWDPLLSPSLQCGVTSVISGNCGFSVAPLVPSEADYMMRMLARVEGMPEAALAESGTWDWTSFGSFLGRVEGKLSINVGFLVGHNALRRCVMGPSSIGREATSDEISAMVALLAQSLREGGLGFSTTRGASHNDHFGDPVPSRAAAESELLALCREVRNHPGTSLALLPTMGEYDETVRELMTAMALAADRPLNWNSLSVRPGPGEEAIRAQRLGCSDYARERGGRVLGLILAQPMRMRLNLGTGVLYDSFPGWGEIMKLPLEAKRQALGDPAIRGRLREGAKSAPSPHWADWAHTRICDAGSPTLKPLVGATVGEVAHARGVDAFELYLDLALQDGLQIGYEPPAPGDDDASWAQRAQLWQDERLLVGGSDAGAHLDMMQAFNGHLSVVGRAVRAGHISLEAAVRVLTDVPARTFELTGRGRLAEGWQADLVVFDPVAIAAGPVEVRHDLPAGAWRLYGEAHGIDRVIVNGFDVIERGEPTNARSGAVLRSGPRSSQTGGSG